MKNRNRKGNIRRKKGPLPNIIYDLQVWYTKKHSLIFCVRYTDLSYITKTNIKLPWIYINAPQLTIHVLRPKKALNSPVSKWSTWKLWGQLDLYVQSLKLKKIRRCDQSNNWNFFGQILSSYAVDQQSVTEDDDT